VLAVRQVADGRRYVHPRLGADLLATDAEKSGRPVGPGGELSARETDVLRLLAQGYTNAQAAEKLSASVRTIETHRAHIQQKLGIRTRAELVRAARESGLLAGP
jgi:DNA-binding NarL/FixJ family response regulator